MGMNLIRSSNFSFSIISCISILGLFYTVLQRHFDVDLGDGGVVN